MRAQAALQGLKMVVNVSLVPGPGLIAVINAAQRGLDAARQVYGSRDGPRAWFRGREVTVRDRQLPRPYECNQSR